MLAAERFALLDVAHPHGMMASAVPALLALAVQYGDGFPARAWPVAVETWRSVGFKPDAETHQRQARSFETGHIAPFAGHDHPARSELNCVAAERNELLLSDAVEIHEGNGMALFERECAVVGLRPIGRVGDDAIDLAQCRHDVEGVGQIERSRADLFFWHNGLFICRSCP